MLPLLMAILGLFPGLARRLPTVAALLMSLQLPLVVAICRPAFAGSRLDWGDFAIDGFGALFTCITTIVAAAAMIQASFLLPAERESSPMSDRRFCFFYTLCGLFVVAMYAVPLAQHLGYMWIALEATTLMSAPLVDFHRSGSSLEATWKYLLLCSVGIAFALFGTILIFAAQHAVVGGGSLSLRTLLENASHFDQRLLRIGFIFCLLGYGTKAGIFPLHSWLPDAHSEAPAPISAMLSGALLNCALVAIWRVSQITVAAGQSGLVRDLLVPAGTITVTAASLMLVRQHSLKRMLAYSSVEHVGLLVVAIGIGAGPIFMLHAFNHSLVKAALFLMSGNIAHVFGTKSLSKITGTLRFSPAWGIVLVLGGFAIAGSPPFGTFLSEWLLLKATFSAQEFWAWAVLLIGLTVGFLAISSHLVGIVFGSEPNKPEVRPKWSWASAPTVLIAGCVITGLFATPSAIAMLTSIAGAWTR